MNDDLYDITIIGGGPTGLFAAFYAGMRQMKVKMIESLPQLGGQLGALYPEKYIYDVAGFPKIKAKDLVKNLIDQAFQFHPAIVLKEKVEALTRQSDGTFMLKTHKGEHWTKTVLITAGVGAFEPRPLKVDNPSACGTENVHYFVDDVSRFKNKRVAILGGGDSAVDWANTLEPIAKEVTVIHRRFQFRAHETSISQMMQSSVNIVFPFRAQSIIGDAKRIHQLMVQDTGSESTQKIPLDELIVCYGFVSSLGPIKNWGLSIKKNVIFVNSKMETNIPGVYAAGDIAAYDGKVRLIASGFGESPIAVNHAKHYIDPTARTQPVHSSSATIFS
ncbi:NAD(P)/FAD-dependent oxidoreductase [Sporolactobacillus sp. THM7-7]|nr:NAD(P)/FAD-dependent oxidoreductase [Sporolactobacillus sp. THM7-7]